MNTSVIYTVTPRSLEREETLKNFIFIRYFIIFVNTFANKQNLISRI